MDRRDEEFEERKYFPKLIGKVKGLADFLEFFHDNGNGLVSKLFDSNHWYEAIAHVATDVFAHLRCGGEN